MPLPGGRVRTSLDPATTYDSARRFLAISDSALWESVTRRPVGILPGLDSQGQGVYQSLVFDPSKRRRARGYAVLAGPCRTPAYSAHPTVA